VKKKTTIIGILIMIKEVICLLVTRKQELSWGKAGERELRHNIKDIKKIYVENV